MVMNRSGSLGAALAFVDVAAPDDSGISFVGMAAPPMADPPKPPVSSFQSTLAGTATAFPGHPGGFSGLTIGSTLVVDENVDAVSAAGTGA